MKKLSVLIFIVLFTNYFSQDKNKDTIINTYTRKCAYKYGYLSIEWEDCINNGIKQDSTIALFWHHKALPLWKTRKYELAVDSYDRAVKYDRQQYLGRRGYLKCIFQKNYRDALKDINMATKEFGDGIQNDHSYDFYKSLCYLQLNEFDNALTYMQREIDKTKKQAGEDWVPAVCYFYTGIIFYEEREFNKATAEFIKALKINSNFSDAEYYLALNQYKLDNDKTKYLSLVKKANQDFKKGFTFNEGDSPYEKFPYQVNWEMINITQ